MVDACVKALEVDELEKMLTSFAKDMPAEQIPQFLIQFKLDPRRKNNKTGTGKYQELNSRKNLR